jgi:hypothetical protein
METDDTLSWILPFVRESLALCSCLSRRRREGGGHKGGRLGARTVIGPTMLSEGVEIAILVDPEQIYFHRFWVEE